MSERISLVVVDDHPLYRSGVVRTLVESGRFEILGEGASAAEATELCARLAPSTVLLDISMPGNGVAAARKIHAANPATAIVMLTVSEQDDDVLAALAAGARGYVLKGIGGDELVAMLEGIARGETYVAPSLAARLLVLLQGQQQAGPARTAPVDTLTAREEQILRLVAAGLSNKEVGRKLDLQEKTVKHYMTNILQKLQARNRVEAALIARDRWKS
ncbi:LuxR C-terminal-related transcriptional regulator [Methylobrevis pamukkalensis]|uniref:Transcriptional regulatory protein DegU n=1 Tax=Methylobrevis pamukkalensis TaxID=1439726 RepID=A0A1E3H7V7_9HYPH|nr:response regulator transcription factor [Methylobrevis pamukkalensis]ODN72403.1 Transcriptional regulatory protein DegU [Methylobrevis pamukkalensis]